MLRPILAIFAGPWAWALAVGWVIPASAAAVSFIAAKFLGGDWWLALVLAAGAAGFVFVWARFGLKAALGWAGGIAGYALFRLGQRRGATIQAAKEKADADRRAVARERIQEDVRRASDADLRRRAARWVRD